MTDSPDEVQSHLLSEKQTPVQQQQREEATDIAEEGANIAGESKYVVKYVNNNSQKWDGREIVVDGDWLEELYPTSAFVAGNALSLPWEGKEWNVVLVRPHKEKSLNEEPTGKVNHLAT